MMDLYVAMVSCIVQFDEDVVCTCMAPMSAVTKAESGWFVTSALRGRDFDRKHAISCEQGFSRTLRLCGFRHSLSLRLDLCGLTHINYWHPTREDGHTCAGWRGTPDRHRNQPCGE